MSMRTAEVLAVRRAGKYHRRSVKISHLSSALGIAVWGLVTLAGCATGADSADKQLRSVQLEILRLKSQNSALSQRVEALESHELAATSVAHRGAAPAEPEPSDVRPTLAVVRLSPPVAREATSPEPEYPTVTLRSGPAGQVAVEQVPPPKRQ
jgi:outer membrane murein-binding lipoprotein Lpp